MVTLREPLNPPRETGVDAEQLNEVLVEETLDPYLVVSDEDAGVLETEPPARAGIGLVDASHVVACRTDRDLPDRRLAAGNVSRSDRAGTLLLDGRGTGIEQRHSIPASQWR